MPVEKTPMNPRSKYALPARGALETGATACTLPGFMAAQPPFTASEPAAIKDMTMERRTQLTATAPFRRAYSGERCTRFDHSTNDEPTYRTLTGRRWYSMRQVAPPARVAPGCPLGN